MWTELIENIGEEILNIDMLERTLEIGAIINGNNWERKDLLATVLIHLSIKKFAFFDYTTHFSFVEDHDEARKPL